MKKIFALTTVALATLVGCATPTDNLCIEMATCAEEEDPETFCKDQKADQDEDEKACSDACSAENNAWAQCLIDNGECEEVAGTDTKMFGMTAMAEDCEELGTAASECVEEKC